MAGLHHRRREWSGEGRGGEDGGGEEGKKAERRPGDRKSVVGGGPNTRG